MARIAELRGIASIASLPETRGGTELRTWIIAIAAITTTGGPALAQVPAQAPSLEFVFEEIVTLAPAVTPGTTPRGGRRIIPITGGSFEGPAIRGQVMPGGWDWQLDRPDGCTDVVADYFLKTDDGVVINVRNIGTLCRDRPVRTHPVFEAPIGKYDWLNKTAFLGTLELGPGAPGSSVKIRFYQVR